MPGSSLRLPKVSLVERYPRSHRADRVLLETSRTINGSTSENQKAIEEDKLQILRKMMDKEEIQVPEHNPTIDLTVDSDNEETGNQRNGRTPSKTNGHSRKGKERANGTPRTPGAASFRPHGSLFHNEINLPDDDASLRHSTRRWHSPASQARGTPSRQTPNTNKYLDRSTLGTSTWSTQRLTTPTRPKLGQTLSTLGNSIAKLESAQRGNASPSVASVGDSQERDRWGLNAKQREKLDKTVPRFRECVGITCWTSTELERYLSCRRCQKR